MPLVRWPLLAATFILYQLNRRPYYVAVKGWNLPGPQRTGLVY